MYASGWLRVQLGARQGLKQIMLARLSCSLLAACDTGSVVQACTHVVWYANQW